MFIEESILGDTDEISLSGSRAPVPAGTISTEGVNLETPVISVGTPGSSINSGSAQRRDIKDQLKTLKEVTPIPVIKGKVRRKMASLAQVRPFTGKREAKENAEDFLDDVEFAAEQCATDKPDDKMFIRLFRQHVKDKALDFWLELEPEKKIIWEDVKALFLGKFGGAWRLDQSERMSVTSRVMAMTQEKRSITEYIKDAKQLYREVPTELSEMFAICFMKGLADATKKASVSFALRDAKVDFKKALEVVKALYMVIRDPDVFDPVTSEKAIVAALANTEVLSELLKFLKTNGGRQGGVQPNQGRVIQSSSGSTTLLADD